MPESCICNNSGFGEGRQQQLDTEWPFGSLPISQMWHLQDEVDDYMATLSPAAAQTMAHLAFECLGAIYTRIQLVELCQSVVDSGAVDIDMGKLIDASMRARPDDMRCVLCCAGTQSALHCAQSRQVQCQIATLKSISRCIAPCLQNMLSECQMHDQELSNLFDIAFVHIYLWQCYV